MKIKFTFLSGIIFLSSFLSLSLYAQEEINSVASSATTKTESIDKERKIVSVEEVVDGKNDISFSVSSLDEAWKKREDLDEERAILKFLQSEPEVPDDFEVSWRVARLVYFVGNFGIGETLPKTAHVKIFQYGYKSAEIAKKLEPRKVEGYYWYAVDLGSYGLAKGVFSALSNAKAGRDALLQAVEIDPKYHWGGPYRVLGRYYQEVPSFISFGDKKKAEEYFKKAIDVAPDFRLNTVYLGVLLSDEGEKKDALALFRQAEQLPDVDGKIEEEHYKRNLALDIKKAEK